MRDHINAGHLRTLITLACVSSAEFIGYDQLKNTVASKKILEKYIAIPIFLRRSVQNYKKISKGLVRLI